MSPAEPDTSRITLRGVVRYHGAAFAGWQVQPDQRTVQGVVEDALGRIAGESIRVHGAGRTDAGVHALGQVLSFAWPARSDWARLSRALSGMLGPDVLVTRLEPAPPGFDARRSARAKLYAYVLHLARYPDPFTAGLAWCVPPATDLDRLARLAAGLAGRRDFAGFQCGGASPGDTVRTVHSVRLLKGGVVGHEGVAGLWRLEFHGDGFLYKMVRNLTGTLIDIARGAVPEEQLQRLLASPGPFRGHTAPAHGLFLIQVSYPDGFPQNE